MKQYLRLTIMLITTLCFFSSPALAIQNTGEVVIGDRTEYVIPFELDGHTIIVPVKFNGADTTYRFIFDTGGLTFVEPDIAAQLNLERGMTVPTFDSTVKAYSTILDTVNLGGARVVNLVGVIYDFLNSVGFTRYDGMIGSDFVSFYTVTIDYRAQTLTLSHDTDSLETVDGTFYASLTRQEMMGAPMADGMIEGHIPAECMIDVGSPYGLVMPLSWMDVLYGYQTSHLIPSVGIMAKWPYSEDKKNYLGRLKSLTLGDFTIEHVPVIFADVHDILIGRDILEQFVTIMNYPTCQMRIIPYHDMTFADNVFSVGLRIRRGPDNQVRVTGLWKNSPAHRAGIKPGDNVLAINDREISEYAMWELTDLFRNDSVTTVTINIRNEQGTHEYILNKEYILPEISK